MLTPDGRSVLLDDLRAPAGYRIEHAVATTFTLDLTAAMLPPFAFADLDTTTSRPDPISMLHALRNASTKVDIFCQAGAIGVPRSADLVAFLEPMIHQVTTTRRLFHPKVWVMKYNAEGLAPRFRLLVLSRNLTHDNTWDVAVRLDSSEVEDRRQAVNDPLVNLLRWLPSDVQHIDVARRDRLLALADEISMVRWEHPDDVEAMSFHAVGLPGGESLCFEPARRQVVISPFVTPDGLRQVAQNAAETILISRQETLDLIPEEDLGDIESYTMAADAEIPETPEQQAEEEAETPPGLTGLHAKVYVREPSSRWTRSHVLMGSANATGPGFSSNVEFMVEVEGRRERLGVDQVLPPDGDTKIGIRQLVEPYVRQEPAGREEEKTQRRLQRLLRDIAARAHTVQVSGSGSQDSAYRATATSASPYPNPSAADVEFSVALLTRPGSAVSVDGSLKLVVDGLDLADITPCLEVTATQQGITISTVVIAQLVGAPEKRLDAVIARQVNDPAKFMRLLLLMLSLGDPGAMAALLAGGHGEGDGSLAMIRGGGSGVLELVLRGMESRSDAIDDVQRLIDALDEEVLPEGFSELWSVVVEARELLEGDE